MKFKNKAGKVGGACGVGESSDELNPEQDPELLEALRDFRLSVCAWSEAAMNRPRTVVDTGRHRIWRLATALALGCVLIAGGVSGGIYKHLRRQQTAGWEQHQQETRIAVARAVEPERPTVVQRDHPAREEEEDLLVKVDRDVSRQVPAAMEPLAQLMTWDETR
jgi:post-segregation antitoxin (ccd killing protein)